MDTWGRANFQPQNLEKIKTGCEGRGFHKKWLICESMRRRGGWGGWRAACDDRCVSDGTDQRGAARVSFAKSIIGPRQSIRTVRVRVRGQATTFWYKLYFALCGRFWQNITLSSMFSGTSACCPARGRTDEGGRRWSWSSRIVSY